MLGVDPADHERFKRWSDQSVRSLNPMLTPEERAEVNQADAEYRDYLHRAVRERRGQAHDDVIGRLLEAQDGDDRLTDDEIVTTCALLLSAGNVTTTDLIGNGVLALLRHPEQLALVRREPERIPNLVEEVLRYDPPVVRIARIAGQDVEVAGCPVPKRAMSNRSGSGTQNGHHGLPREEIRHQAFGGGIHFCLGAALARMEAQVAFGLLLERFDVLRLDPEAELVYRTVPHFRGLKHLPLVATAARGARPT